MDLYKIAIIEDDMDLQEIVIDHLRRSGFEAVGYESHERFFSEADIRGFDGFLIDRKLPGKSGLEIVRVLKGMNVVGPIIMVTGQSEPAEIIEGIEAGADDYVTKPFRYDILVSKINQSIERFRSLAQKGHFVEVPKKKTSNGLFLDENAFELKDGKNAVRFTRTEFQIFKPLFERMGTFVKREELFAPEFSQKSRSLDVHIASIRKKIKAYALDIETLRGVGYRLGFVS